MSNAGNSAGKSGSTVSEVLIAMMIIGVSAAAVNSGIGSARRMTAINTTRLAAANQAQAKMEELRRMDFYRICPGGVGEPGFINATVVGSNDVVFNAGEDVRMEYETVLSDPPWLRINREEDWKIPPLIEGRMKVYVANIDDVADGIGKYDINTYTTDCKQVTVEMQWSCAGANHRYALVSLLSGPPGCDYVGGSYTGGTYYADQDETNSLPFYGYAGVPVTPSEVLTNATPLPTKTTKEQKPAAKKKPSKAKKDDSGT